MAAALHRRRRCTEAELNLLRLGRSVREGSQSDLGVEEGHIGFLGQDNPTERFAIKLNV